MPCQSMTIFTCFFFTVVFSGSKGGVSLTGEVVRKGNVMVIPLDDSSQRKAPIVPFGAVDSTDGGAPTGGMPLPRHGVGVKENVSKATQWGKVGLCMII